jgi:hypothetical protein
MMMNTERALVVVALVLAVLALVVTGYPLLVVAVILLCIGRLT